MAKLAKPAPPRGETAASGGGDEGALRRSLAVIGAVEKLKNQGAPITEKAEMDYVQALRFVERASKAAGRDLLVQYRGRPGAGAGRRKNSPVKRNPKDNPREFEKAFKDSTKIVQQVETLQKQGKPVPVKLMETYTLCKKFLEKYK
ncbi:MAG: hypothetical protein NT166_08225 [Candidatus Aminicenantes bacterium]|nr:hypothetical protein [Candidatus Aminicenantes bacterium]